MTRKRSFYGLLVLLSAAVACRGQTEKRSTGAKVSQAAPTPSATPVERASSRAAELQRKLKKLDVFVDVPGETRRIDVQAEARVVLKELKDALLESVDRALPGTLDETDPTGALERTMRGEGLEWAASDDWTERAIDGSIEPVPKHRERWVATLCVLLAPGSDCMLVVYERREGRVRQVLVVRSDLYDSIEGALHAVTWAISPPDAEDGFYLLEAHTHPWPASRWRTFTYRALLPTESPQKPTVVAEASAWANWENGFELDARFDGFTVTFDVWSDEPPDYMQKTAHRWARQKDRFRPVTRGIKVGPAGSNGAN